MKTEGALKTTKKGSNAIRKAWGNRSQTEEV